MKKYWMALLVALIIAFSALPSWATAGSCVQSFTRLLEGVYVVKLVCTGDSTDGSLPDTTISSYYTSSLKGFYLYTISAYPTSGGTAPDAADVFVLDAAGEDLLGSADGGTTANKGANLIHATLKKTTMPYSYYLSNAYFPSVVGSLVVRVANQSTISANYTIELVFAK
jgi:hypothetical protein